MYSRHSNDLEMRTARLAVIDALERVGKLGALSMDLLNDIALGACEQATARESSAASANVAFTEVV